MGIFISRTKIVGQTFVINFSNFGGFSSNFGTFFSNVGGIFSLKFDHSFDFDCPNLRSGIHFFIYFASSSKERSRRGYGLSE